MAKTVRLGVHAAAVGATLVAVGLLVLMVVAAQQPAEATFPGKNGKIAYTTTRDEVIYTINPVGGAKVKVTEGSGPSYSPNGKRIAYSASDGHDQEIYTINAGGGDRFKVTNNKTDDSFPSWGNR
jgi:Tol biopolymer transport system component